MLSGKYAFIDSDAEQWIWQMEAATCVVTIVTWKFWKWVPVQLKLDKNSFPILNFITTNICHIAIYWEVKVLPLLAFILYAQKLKNF